jgi:hypothetical protein
MNEMTNPDEEEMTELTADLEEIAEAQINFMIQNSPFQSDEWTENNGIQKEW